jgi:hypothetical protein
MVMGQMRRAVGTFATRGDAEQALHELQQSGFTMNNVSIIAQDANRQPDIAGVDVQKDVGNQADEGAATGALTGGAVGGLAGLLVGLGALAIPGVGPIILAGEVATTLATTLAGGAIGAAAGGLVGGLIGLGVPEHRARAYNDRVSRGEYLVIVDGTEPEIARAEAILSRRGIQDWGIYDTQQTNAATTPSASGSYSGDTMPITAPAAATTPVVTTPMTSSTSPLSSSTPSIATSDYTLTPMDRVGTQGNHHRQRALGVFSSRLEADSALNALKNSGFSMNDVSVIAKDANSGEKIAGKTVQDPDSNKADEGAVKGAVTGGAVGGLGGLLVGLGALAIPGIGPVMLAGATATALATTLSGTALGAAAGSLAGALIGLGIPEERARLYNSRISQGDYLIIVEGNAEQIQRAQSILTQQGIQEWGTYDALEQSPNQAQNPLRQDHDPMGTASRPVDYQGTATSTSPEVIIVDRREESL